MNKLIKESLDKIIVDEELQIEENHVKGTVILHRCSFKDCNTYKRADGLYAPVHEALDKVFLSNPDIYQVSSGYCDFHLSLEEAKIRESNRQKMKGLS